MSAAASRIALKLPINREPTNGAVKQRPSAPQPVEFNKPINRAQQMFRRHMPFGRKLVKQRVLPDLPFPDHPLR
jgi:hypothetical protein